LGVAAATPYLNFDLAETKNSSARHGLNNTAATACEFSRRKMTRFGRTTRVREKENDTFLRVFSPFHVFFFCNLLPPKKFHGAEGPEKNRAKKPTVGFWSFCRFGNILGLSKKFPARTAREAATMPANLNFWASTTRWTRLDVVKVSPTQSRLVKASQG
jgi:hypothetical protein